MSGFGKGWHACTLALALVACGESHSADDGGAGDTGVDTGVDSSMDGTLDAFPDAIACPPVLPETCVRGECCDEDPRLAERVGDTCTFACPDGWTPESTCVVEDIAFCGEECGGNEDCTLAWNTCCGTCSVPTLADYDAIGVDRQEEHRAMVCPDPVPCPLCVEGFNPNLGATCELGTCRGFDLSMMALTECSDDIDCRVRARGCCECGADTSFGNLIAIRGDGNADYEALVCPSDSGCLECAPAYPPDVRAFCDTGRCALEMVPAP